MKISMYLILSLFALFLFWCLPYETAFHYSYLLFFSNFLFSILFILTQKQKIKVFLFFSPCLISYIYLTVNIFLGAYIDSNTDINDVIGRMHERIANFPPFHFFLINTFFYIDGLILFMIFSKKMLDYNKNVSGKSENTDEKSDSQGKEKKAVFSLLACFVLLIFFSFFGLNLSFIGGEGDFSFIVIFGVAIYAFFCALHFPIRIRLLVYLTFMTTVFLGSVESKREFMFMFILVMFFMLAQLKKDFLLNLKTILGGILVLAVAICLVLAASIMRGYGSFGVENMFQAFCRIPDYIQMPQFIPGVVENFEISWVYVLSFVCFEYVLSGYMPLLYGQCFLRFFLFPVPRYILESKPRAFVLQFTSLHTPGWEGSSPVVFLCEYFANFHFLHLILLPIIYYMLETFFFYALREVQKKRISIKAVMALFISFTVINHTRGQGLSDFLVTVLIPLPAFFLLQAIYNAEAAKNSSNMCRGDIEHESTYISK